MIEKKDLEKNFENKTIIITGGLGFIGSNLAHRLVKLNTKRIIIIDALIKGRGGNIYNVKDIMNKVEIPFLEGGGLNINDDRIINYLDGVDYIFNLAGSVSHIDSKNNPLEDLKINLLDHVAFLE
ncbi:MAG: NAD-dependent epimerase/dehydratase family protein, partial [Nanoarchaeota archaeon]